MTLSAIEIIGFVCTCIVMGAIFGFFVGILYCGKEKSLSSETEKEGK